MSTAGEQAAEVCVVLATTVGRLERLCRICRQAGCNVTGTRHPYAAAADVLASGATLLVVDMDRPIIGVDQLATLARKRGVRCIGVVQTQKAVSSYATMGCLSDAQLAVTLTDSEAPDQTAPVDDRPQREESPDQPQTMQELLTPQEMAALLERLR